MDPVTILNDSRIAPTGNGNLTEPNNTPPTSGHKWWAAVVLGLIFALLSSPVAYQISETVVSTVGLHTVNSSGVPNLFGLVVQTAIFVLVVRLILW